MVDPKDVVRTAADKVTDITPSVIVLAMAAGITPKVFAKNLFDREAHANYLVDLQTEFARLAIAESKKNDQK